MKTHCSFVNIACSTILASIGLGYLFFAYISSVYHLPYMFLCPFYLITSIHCPLCGMTHAFGELFNGNIEKAIEYNAHALSLFVSWIIYTVSAIFLVVKDTKNFRDSIK